MGFLNKYHGDTGASVWSVSYSSTSSITSVDAVDETAYVSGLFEGSAVNLLGAGVTLSSSSDADNEYSDAFVAALDASGVSGPVPLWVVQIGRSSRYPSVKAEGDFLYVAGSLAGPGREKIPIFMSRAW